MYKLLVRRLTSFLSPFLFNRYFSNINKKLDWNGRKAAFTISFDCDYPEDVLAVPKLLKLLREYKIKSSFACIGKFVELYPDIHKKILKEGHEIINHTYSHPDGYWNKGKSFHEISFDEQVSEISKFDAVCKKLLGYKPVGFRTPHFGKSHVNMVYKIISDNGYLYSSSTNLTNTQSYGFPYKPSKNDFKRISKAAYGVLELPLLSCPQHYFSVFDTWHCFRSNPGAHTKPGEFLKLFIRSLEIALNHGIYVNLYFDPRDIIRLREFERCLELLSSKKKEIWIDSSDNIIKFWRENENKLSSTSK